MALFRGKLIDLGSELKEGELLRWFSGKKLGWQNGLIVPNNWICYLVQHDRVQLKLTAGSYPGNELKNRAKSFVNARYRDFDFMCVRRFMLPASDNETSTDLCLGTVLLSKGEKVHLHLYSPCLRMRTDFQDQKLPEEAFRNCISWSGIESYLRTAACNIASRTLADMTLDKALTLDDAKLANLMNDILNGISESAQMPFHLITAEAIKLYSPELVNEWEKELKRKQEILNALNEEEKEEIIRQHRHEAELKRLKREKEIMELMHCAEGENKDISERVSRKEESIAFFREKTEKDENRKMVLGLMKSKKPSHRETEPVLELWKSDIPIAREITPRRSHSKETFHIGDLLEIRCRCSHNGYIYLFNLGTGGSLTLLFPNEISKKNMIEAVTPIEVPGWDSDFNLSIDGPAGTELVMGIYCAKELESVRNELKEKDDEILFMRWPSNKVDSVMKNIYSELNGLDSGFWAHAGIWIKVRE